MVVATTSATATAIITIITIIVSNIIMNINGRKTGAGQEEQECNPRGVTRQRGSLKTRVKVGGSGCEREEEAGQQPYGYARAEAEVQLIRTASSPKLVNIPPIVSLTTSRVLDQPMRRGGGSGSCGNLPPCSC